MQVQIRKFQAEDIPACAPILHSAFAGIAAAHNFPPDFPDPDFAAMVLTGMAHNPTSFGVVAEAEGVVVGSNFLAEAGVIRSIGPISVAANLQSRGAGRLLMEAVLERAAGAAGVRLIQDAFNMASLSLYAKLGFAVKEPLVLMEGDVRRPLRPGSRVRPLDPGDLEACGRLCESVHGYSRARELAGLPDFVTPLVLEREGALRAYASAPGFWPLNHAVAESDEDLQELLGATGAPVRLLIPTRTAVFSWALEAGLRAVKPMTLMARGQYQEPRGAWLPSVGY